jgi:hypothetical protein
MVPTGIVDDPWNYDIIHEGIRLLSNPVVVNENIYFVASDGLLWVTNGSTVTELKSSFDLTKYVDFEEDKPVWLVYAEEINALVAYYPETANNSIFVISLANGGVSQWEVPNSSNTSSSYPRSVVAIENSSDKSLYMSYPPRSTDKDALVIAQFSTGSSVTGVDSLAALAADDDYWYGDVQSGVVFFAPEGIKVGLKSVIIYTYTDTTVATNNPDVIVEVKSLEDSGWNGPRDLAAEGHITVTTSACTLDSTGPPSAFSSLLGTASGAVQTFDLPWLAKNVRVYTETGGTYTSCSLVTSEPTAANQYQVSGTQEIKVFGTNGHSIYCYCENEPAIVVESGDYVESDEGLHRISSITNYTTAALDRYKATGSDTDCIHLSAEQMPAGEGQIKIGVNRLVDGVQFRLRVAPRHGSGVSSQPTVAKIIGISFGYMPTGERLVAATGG